jgi:hypothetical protein
MPAILSVDQATGDLSLTNAIVDLVDDREAIVQHCRTRLRMITGDSVLRASVGIDLQTLASGVPLDAIEGMLRTLILGTPGIVTIDEAELTPDGDSLRTITYRFEATISLGDRRDRVVIADTLQVAASQTPGETQALITG